MYTVLLTDQPSPLRPAFDASVLNAGFFLAMDEDRPRVLADLDERALAPFLDSITGREFDDPCRYLGFDLTVGIMAAIRCNEYLLHGFDMARAVGQDWTFSESAADLTLDVMGPILMSFLDPAKADDLEASFAIEARSGRFCGQAAGGVMDPLAADDDTDCSIMGPSSQILLWLTGRVGWEDAKLSASGPRPEVAPTLADKLVHF
jgi:hypothetical protein